MTRILYVRSSLSKSWANPHSIDCLPHFESHFGARDRTDLIDALPPPPPTSPTNNSAPPNNPHLRQIPHNSIRLFHPQSDPRRDLGRPNLDRHRPRLARRNDANLRRG